MSDPADDALRMLQVGSLVAAVAVPVAMIAAVAIRLRGDRICPRWSTPHYVWPGPVVLGFFLGCQLGLPSFAAALDSAGLFRLIYPSGFPRPEGVSESEFAQVASHLKVMWTSLGLVPVVLLAAAAVRTTAFAAPPRVSVPPLLRAVALGTLAWLAVGTAAYLLNLLLQVLFQQLGLTVTEHPLSKLGPTGDGVGGWLFVLSACVAAPLLEEFLFRGLLVDWAGGRWHRPWVLVSAAAGWVVLTGGGRVSPAPLAFVAVLGVGLYLLQRVAPKVRRRFPKRTAWAVWGSSALFAAVHSSVWPTPIPLFVLGLGLGHLTARARTWLPAAVAHGLFNLVSTLFVFARG